MATWIKLCGLSSVSDVRVASECAVQAVGFVFADSVRSVTPKHARQLAEQVADGIATVAVMLRPEQAELDDVLNEFAPDFVQADWQALAGLRLPADIGTLPVYRQGDGAGPDTTPPRFVFEGSLSGQGETVDWHGARPYAGNRELILAGGLSPENVARAMQVLAPFGVDVSSGIERKRGVKDHQRMREFVARVRAAEP